MINLEVYSVILAEDEYKELMSKVNLYFGKKKIDITIKDEYTIELPKGNEKERVVSIRNLLKICKDAKKENWDELVKEFFDILEEADHFDQIYENMKNSFDAMKEFIGVRFWPKGYLGDESEKSSIFLPLLEDVYLALIFDFPKYTKNILPEYLKKWNKNEKELFKIGYTNIKSNYPYTIKEQIVHDVRFYRVITEHFFGNMVLFDLKEKNLVGNYGSLIIVPNRLVTFIYPILNREVDQAIKRLIYIADIEFNEPGSLSRNLYWYKDGSFSLQRVEKIGKSFVFIPTDDFSKILNNLK